MSGTGRRRHPVNRDAPPGRSTCTPPGSGKQVKAARPCNRDMCAFLEYTEKPLSTPAWSAAAQKRTLRLETDVRTKGGERLDKPV